MFRARQYHCRAIGYQPAQAGLILNSVPPRSNLRLMKTYLFALGMTILLAVMANSAFGACYAGYKAKQDDPLKLHYGVAEVPDDSCTRDSAEKALRDRLKNAGWTLLKIVATFDETELPEKKAAAGDYFLRY